ncbi:MFS transporter [Dactylosporangium darangshiense]|uniref:MFS transporter n=1 Tax=Dactylosporangium darangshiense TaxID=579108 RepID=A0ABP8DF01_9ACTN
MSATTAPAPPAAGRRLGVATWVIAVARFIVVLDGTIMIVALPSIERSLHLSPSGLNWVINAYALTFGGLMLAAGRAADVLGRRRVFRVGLALFGIASLLGGLAPGGGWLVALRAVQGVGAAIATPGALSLLVSTFPEGQPRTRALGLYGAMTGLASVLGLLLGGVLTTYAGWRWVLFVNVPVVAALLLGTATLHDGNRDRGRFDLAGGASATLGVGALVFAINRVGERGWSDPIVLGVLAFAVVLLAAFVAIQRTAALPMIPRDVVANRARAGANAVTLIMSAGSFATYYFLTLYMQQELGYSALRTGLLYLPFAIGFGLAAGAIGPQLLRRASPRIALAAALLLAAAGTAWFCLLTPDRNILAVLVPASLVTGMGLGATAVVATGIGVRGIDDSEAGIGSALLTAGSQVGGAIGLATLATVATTTSYTTGFAVAVALYLVAALVGALTAG